MMMLKGFDDLCKSLNSQAEAPILYSSPLPPKTSNVRVLE